MYLLFGKIYDISPSGNWERTKRKTYSVNIDLQAELLPGLSIFWDDLLKPEAFCSDWLVSGRACKPHGKGGPTGSLDRRGTRLLATFWMEEGNVHP